MPGPMLEKDLVRWYQRHHRKLPWRRTRDPYSIWISEVMLQQTQVDTALPYYERFLERFPTVQSLSRAKQTTVLKYWAGLGYYSRARRLHEAAKIMAKEGVPKTLEGWLALPGVGPYTAGAVTSIAFNLPSPIVDGNVERVLSRIHRTHTGHWDLAQAHVQRATPRLLNQAMMELGALVCTPQRPNCVRCPVKAHCKALAQDKVSQFPKPKKRKAFVEVQERALALVDSRGRILLRKREEGEWHTGLWDLPILENLPKKGSQEASFETRYVVTHHKVTRKVVVWKGGAPRVNGEIRWVEVKKIAGLPVGAPIRKALKRLEKNVYG